MVSDQFQTSYDRIIKVHQSAPWDMGPGTRCIYIDIWMAATARVRNPTPFTFALLFILTKKAAHRISYIRVGGYTRDTFEHCYRRTPYEPPSPPLGALVSRVTFFEV